MIKLHLDYLAPYAQHYSRDLIWTYFQPGECYYGFHQIYQGHDAERQGPQGPAEAADRREEEAPVGAEGSRRQPFGAERREEGQEEKVRLVGGDAARNLRITATR